MQPVMVNDVAIPHATIAREVQNHQAESPAVAWEQATRALVIRELLLQRARALDLVADPRIEDGARETDEESLIRLLLEREVITPKADDAVCRRYYDSNPARFRSPDLFEPAHILFKARRDDVDAYAKAEAQAAAVLGGPPAAPGQVRQPGAQPVRLPVRDGRRAAGTDRAGRDDPGVRDFSGCNGAWPNLPNTGAHALRCPRAPSGPQDRGRDVTVRLRPHPDRQPIWKSAHGVARSRNTSRWWRGRRGSQGLTCRPPPRRSCNRRRACSATYSAP